MSTIAINGVSGEIFATMLTNLLGVLDKAEAHARAKNFDIEVLLNARLAPDMFNLIGQVQLATAFAKNAMCRLAGQTPPDFPDAEKTVADLRARITRALDIVGSIGAKELESAATREITFRVGPDTTLSLPGAAYLAKFALPNFFFHVSMAYAILRHNGVDLGKRDYMGAPPQ